MLKSNISKYSVLISNLKLVRLIKNSSSLDIKLEIPHMQTEENVHQPYLYRPKVNARRSLARTSLIRLRELAFKLLTVCQNTFHRKHLAFQGKV